MVAGRSDTSSESEAASERMNEMSLSLDVDRVAVLCCRCAIDTHTREPHSMVTSSSSSTSSTTSSIVTRKDSAAWQGLAAILSGSAAGLTADACTHPIDTLRTRLQVQNRHTVGAYRGTWDAFVRTRLEGVRGFYRGFSVVATFTVPAHALYFFGYEAGKRYIMPNTPIDEKGVRTRAHAHMMAPRSLG